MRRFMAMGFVLALALLTAETLVISASAHPRYPVVPTDGMWDMGTPVATPTETTTSTTARPRLTERFRLAGDRADECLSGRQWLPCADNKSNPDGHGAGAQ